MSSSTTLITSTSTLNKEERAPTEFPAVDRDKSPLLDADHDAERIADVPPTDDLLPEAVLTETVAAAILNHPPCGRSRTSRCAGTRRPPPAP